MFSPSIYRIEEGDQISPYRNRVIFVFVCVVLWPHGLAIHYNASGLSRLVKIHRIQGQKTLFVHVDMAWQASICDKYDWWIFIVPDSKYYTQKVHITFILGVGTYPTYSCSLVLSTKQYTDNVCWINCWKRLSFCF